MSTTLNVPRFADQSPDPLDLPFAPKILMAQMPSPLQIRSPPRRELEVLLETSRGESESSNLEVLLCSRLWGGGVAWLQEGR